LIKIEGLDGLTKTLEQLQDAMKELDGEIGTVSYNPHDPVSIEQAAQQAAAAIDAKMQPYLGNEYVASIVADMKEQFRESILEQAAAARLAGGDDDEGN
jgi:protoheme ferro-lyase